MDTTGKTRISMRKALMRYPVFQLWNDKQLSIIEVMLFLHLLGIKMHTRYMPGQDSVNLFIIQMNTKT